MCSSWKSWKVSIFKQCISDFQSVCSIVVIWSQARCARVSNKFGTAFNSLAPGWVLPTTTASCHPIFNGISSWTHPRFVKVQFQAANQLPGNPKRIKTCWRNIILKSEKKWKKWWFFPCENASRLKLGREVAQVDNWLLIRILLTELSSTTQKNCQELRVHENR